MKRGTICWVNLESTAPPEFGKTRPGLVISNSEQNAVLNTVVILPISSQTPEIWPLRLEFRMPNGKPSFLVIPGIRQVTKTRLLEIVGRVPADLLARLDSTLLAYLSD